MFNKTENTRALLQRIISDSCDAEGAGEVVIQRADWEELRALLANPSAEPLGVEPVVERQPVAKPVMKLEAERLWEGDGEYSVSFCKPGWLDECRKTGGTFFLFTDPPELAELQATVAHQVELLDLVLANASRALPPAVYTDISAAVDRHRVKAPVSTPNEAEREPFERWHRNRFATKHTTGAPTRDMHNGTRDPNYGPPHQQHMWEAWQARAALSLALPDDWQDQLFAEMERRFELHKHVDDDQLVSDDTQLGVEFARDWVAARLAKDQPACP